MSGYLDESFDNFYKDYSENSISQLSQNHEIIELLKGLNYSDDFKTFSEKQDKILKNQESLIKKQNTIIDLLGKNKNVDYKEIDKILANNVQYLEANTKELINVNKSVDDNSLKNFHSLYYLGSVIIGFFIGYVVINTFLQLAFDN